MAGVLFFCFKYIYIIFLHYKAISFTVGFHQRPLSIGLFSDWILLVLLLARYIGRVDFIVFVLCLEAVGVRQYCGMAVENRLALCASRVLRCSRSTNPRPSELVALGL